MKDVTVIIMIMFWCLLAFFSVYMGIGDNPVVESRTRVQKVRVRAPAGNFSSPGSAFCADSYFDIRCTLNPGFTVSLSFNIKFEC